MLLLGGAPVAGFWLHAEAVRGRTLRETIAKEAVAVTAVVSDLTRTRGKNQRYYVTYEYAAAGQRYERRATVGRSSWTKLRVGDSLAVGYLPSEPGRSWLRGREPGGTPPFWAGPAVGLLMVVLGMLPWYAIRRQWMLLAEGRPAEAQVTVSKKVRHQHGSYYQVSYEFRTLSGAMRSGRYDSHKGPPASGTTIQVVYNPDRPEHSKPYPFGLVRPA
jgi:hypothetical protein